MNGLPHCVGRTRQRYGIVLSPFDVRDLAMRCGDGEGRLETKPDGIAYHALIWGDRILWVVYRSRAHGSTRRHGTIVTIMPPSVGADRCQRDHRHVLRRKHAARRP